MDRFARVKPFLGVAIFVLRASCLIAERTCDATLASRAIGTFRRALDNFRKLQGDGREWVLDVVTPTNTNLATL